MKKLILAFSLFIIHSQIQAQAIRVGAKLGGHTNWLLNDNVFSSSHLNIAPSFGATGGLTASYWFNHSMGVSLDLLYASVNQNYKPDNTDDGDYTLKEKLRYIDLPLLFKVGSNQGAYFEIGPKFSLLTNHKEVLQVNDDFNTGLESSTHSYKNDFNGLVFSIALGFGIDIKINDKMGINTGLRFAYNPGDVLKQHSEDNLTDFSESHSFISQFSSFDNYGGKDPEYKYKKTHLITGGLLVGYYYQFGSTD
jgi:hypothetical protein